jgi:hypothetical protein
VTLWLALLLAALFPAAAVPQTLVLDQPDVIPVRVAIVPTVPFFSDPSLPARQTGLYGMSTVALVSHLRDVFRDDPRFEVLQPPTAQALSRLSGTPTQQERLILAAQGQRLGIGSFRSFNLATAIDELRAAIDVYLTTTAPWLQPEDLADAWLYIALASLELALTDESAAPRHMASARRAFRELILLTPAARMSPDTYPQSTVDLFNEVYAGLLLEGPEALLLPARQATWLATELNTTLVVQLAVVTDAARRQMLLRVWDARTSQYAATETIDLGDTFEGTLWAIDAAISRIRACLEPVFPPPPPDSNERGRIVLYQAAQAGVFLNGPTRRRFTNAGPYTELAWSFTDNAALYAGVSAWFSRPDANGDLVDRLDTIRSSIGVHYVSRVGRFRFTAGAGPEVLYAGRINATLSFWCKVSDGEVIAYDDERACTEDDVVRRDPGIQAGFALRATAGVRAVGPLWFNLGMGTAIYTLPFEDRALDFPLAADAGIALRF